MTTETFGWEYPALNSDVGARLHDFLSRKKGIAAEKWNDLLRNIEANLSPIQLKAAIRGALRSIKRSPVNEDLVDEEFARLCTMIREHGRTTSIENHGQYLFSVDVNLTF